MHGQPGAVMKKQAYLKLCLSMPLEWLKSCVENPSPYMRPIHSAIIKIAMRRKDRGIV